MRKTEPLRTPGSIAVSIVVALMFVTPVLAATSLQPVGFSWTALAGFLSLHRWELVLGFSLMIVISLLLRTTTSAHARRPVAVPMLLAEARPQGFDGLA